MGSLLKVVVVTITLVVTSIGIHFVILIIMIVLSNVLLAMDAPNVSETSDLGIKAKRESESKRKRE